MIEVLATGFYSSLQDAGRFGYRASGVPISGWMDAYSAQLANALLNNDKNDTVLEMTYQGVTLKFKTACSIAITGASCSSFLNDQLIEQNCIQKIKKSDTLKIGKTSNGVYVYLAVSGGFQSSSVLSSHSFYTNITLQSRLKRGEILKIGRNHFEVINQTRIQPDRKLISSNLLEAALGPEFYQLDNETQKNLFRCHLRISQQCNRMAYKLLCPSTLKGKEIITSCVQPGTVQLTPSGELIVLMRDCQTTGGYARILQLKQNSMNQLAQKRIGSQFSFTNFDSIVND